MPLEVEVMPHGVLELTLQVYQPDHVVLRAPLSALFFSVLSSSDWYRAVM
jgi:hypothetical protein